MARRHQRHPAPQQADDEDILRREAPEPEHELIGLVVGAFSSVQATGRPGSR